MQLPLNIPQLDRFTDDELVRFCVANPDLKVERDEDGTLYINTSPTHLLTSANNSELNGEFIIWNRKTKAGKVLDSNGSFFPERQIHESARRVLDSARTVGRPEQEGKAFVPVHGPDFVLELVSDSDNLNVVKAKMEKWLANGVRLAWLVLPDGKLTYIYRPGQPVETKAFTETLSGEDLLIGFETVLADILEE